MNNRFLLLLLSLPFWLALPAQSIAQNKIKSAPFINRPDASEDRYNPRLKHKILAVSGTDFVILSKKSETGFALERYDDNLNRSWSAALPLLANETVAAFFQNEAGVVAVTHRTEAGSGAQTLTGHLFDLKTGQKLETQKLFEALQKGRMADISVSEDGNKMVAYQFLVQGTKITAISASVFDGRFKKLKSRTYNLRDVTSSLSASVQIDNRGDQFLFLISDNSTKLTVRKYTNASETAQVMSVQLGGVFSGSKVYVFQTQYLLEQNGLLYAAALCLEQETADYHSLKLVKFDFNALEMAFAPEFRFTPEYIDSLNKNYPTGKTVKRLEDIELSQLVLTPEKDLVLLAEKRYTEGGENSNYVAKELHLFTYDEYLNLAWRSIIMKNQVASSEDGFTGISYLAKYLSGALNILTLETLNSKTDLYLRRINAHNGAGENPKAIGLALEGLNGTYRKDFTAWLNEKTLITVSKPAKKGAGQQLNKITLK